MSNRSYESEFEQILVKYQRAREWLLSLITDPTGSRYHQEKSQELRFREFREQIDRTQRFLNFVGNPEAKFDSVHVAGTSGKGSVVNMIAAILTAAGLKTGFHISPYLQVCNEKLIVDGKMISPSEFVTLVEEFRNLYVDWMRSGDVYGSLKYGEAWVALTYYWLAKQRVDWGVIETGLGGRYDPTNVLPSKMAVITNVDYDHVVTLGPDLTDIASHKVGIIKPHGLVVTSEQTPEILFIIEKETDENQSRLYRLGKDFDFRVEVQDSDGSVITVQAPHRKYEGVRIAMRGDFQPVNAALAIASVDVLAAEYNIPVNQEVVMEGLEGVQYIGRMEVVQRNPIVILDGAHNKHKMQALVDSLKSIYTHKKIVVIIGMLSTKDSPGMVEILSPITHRWIITQPHVFGKPSTPPDEIAGHIRKVHPSADVQQYDDVLEALDTAISEADQDDLLVVTGSLYLVGEARERWFPSQEILLSLERGS